MPDEKPIEFEKVFASAFKEWREMKETDGVVPDLAAVNDFADWLDNTKFLTPALKILALMRAREVDRAFLNKLIEEIGIEKANEIAQEVQKAFHLGNAKSE